MANWQDYLNNEDSRNRTVKKPNKDQFCRKNRHGKYYGPHAYDTDGRCQFCSRIKDKSNYKEYDIMDDKGE